MADDAGHSRWRPLAEAAGLIALALASAATAPPGRLPLDPVGSLLLVASAAAVAARRWTPVAALVVTTVCLLVYQTAGYPGVASALPVLVALYAAVGAGRRRAAGAAVTIILVVGFTGELALSPTDPVAPDVLQRWFLLVGWMVASCVAAELSRQRRIHLAHAERRAADAERSREEAARRRADEERLRIARELHDSLTHSISIINVQAGVAVHLARKHGQPIPDALVTIQQASQEAMRELRATLKVLRADDDPGRTGLDRLDGLVRGVGDAGLPVRVTVTGQPRRLPTPIDRAAFRIIQESLTNATRHAGPATVSVQLGFGERELVIHVEDDGRGPGSAGIVPGVGLTGMRERVSGLGGSLHVGAGSGRGFRVRATLPLETPS